MLKAVIIEDNFADKQILINLIEKYCKDDVIVVGCVHDVNSAFSLINESCPDILFLDIELGNQSAFDLLSKFSHFSFQIIFISAHDSYAIKAIKFNALDFILKPIEIIELIKAVEKAKSRNRFDINKELENLLQHIYHPHKKSNKIAVPVLTGYKMVAIEDILYCEAGKEYTFIYCINENPICSSINLGEYEKLLLDYSFCRVHHSFLVNKHHVQEFDKTDGIELKINTNTTIPISRRKKNEVINWLTKNND